MWVTWNPSGSIPVPQKSGGSDFDRNCDLNLKDISNYSNENNTKQKKNDGFLIQLRDNS